MAFALKSNESVSKGIRRIARRQIDRMLLGLTGQTTAGLDVMVHDTRQRLKKVRTLIRLVRRDPGKKLATRENARLRDAGRLLSELRDAEVLVEAFDSLIERFGDQGSPDGIQAIRESLLQRRREASRRHLDEGATLGKVAGSLKKARNHVKCWRVKGDEWESLETGLTRIYHQGRRAFTEASETPTDSILHEWRKRVKDLGHVTEILKPIHPSYLKRLRREAHELADYLGEDHDLAVLQQVLSCSGSDGQVCAAYALVRPLIDCRQATLRRNAFSLGRRLYGESPRQFIARIEADWRAWRTE